MGDADIAAARVPPHSVEAEQSVLGAVMLPAHDELFLGIPGVGAWKDFCGTRTAIHARRAPPEGPVVYASSHYRGDPRIEKFVAAHRAQRVVNIGSALRPRLDRPCCSSSKSNCVARSLISRTGSVTAVTGGSLTWNQSASPYPTIDRSAGIDMPRARTARKTPNN